MRAGGFSVTCWRRRAGAKHRQKAFEVGVDMYMSKPYQEDELFKNIDDLLARSRQQLH